MELDDLKVTWTDLNNKVDANRRMTQRLWKDSKQSRVQSTLGWVSFLNVVELLPNLLAVLLTGSFLGSGSQEMRFVIPGLFLHLTAILLIAMNLWQITALARIDYTQPTVTIQRQLAQLRTMRLRFQRAIFVFAPLIWTPLVIVAARGLLHLDIYRAFGLPWIIANLTFGLVAIPLLLFLTHRYERFLGTIGDDIAGRKIAAAEGFLEEIALFEQE